MFDPMGRLPHECKWMDGIWILRTDVLPEGELLRYDESTWGYLPADK